MIDEPDGDMVRTASAADTARGLIEGARYRLLYGVCFPWFLVLLDLHFVHQPGRATLPKKDRRLSRMHGRIAWRSRRRNQGSTSPRREQAAARSPPTAPE